MPTNVWERLVRGLSFLKLGHVPIEGIRGSRDIHEKTTDNKTNLRGGVFKNRDLASFDSQSVAKQM